MAAAVATRGLLSQKALVMARCKCTSTAMMKIGLVQGHATPFAVSLCAHHRIKMDGSAGGADASLVMKRWYGSEGNDRKSRRRSTSSWKRRNASQAERRNADGPGADTSSSQTLEFHDAVERGDLQFVEKQVAKIGASIVCEKDPARANVSPLHIASRRGFVDIVALLLDKGQM